jgi:hypothetical protein
MIYLIANVWNLKMNAETDFEKSARQPMLDKSLNEYQTSGMKCELLNEKSVTVQLEG